MTYSFIVIDLQNEVNATEINKFLQKNYSNCFELIYCSSKASKAKNIKNYVFDSSQNPESVLNTVIKKCGNQNIVVIRDAKNYQEITKLTKNLTQDNQIVYFQKKQSKFKVFWWKLLDVLFKLMFMQQILPVNHSAIAYGEICSSVLKTMESPSLLMRSNSWEGIQFIPCDGGKVYTFKYKKKNHILKTLTALFIPVALIVVKVVTKLNLIPVGHLVYFAVVFICLLIALIFALKWIQSKYLGDPIADKANYK